MTENRKRVSVSVRKIGVSVVVSVMRNVGSAAPDVAALPVRTIETEPYEGSYEANPQFNGYVLPTKGLRMTDDLVINPIYVGDTSNESGGITIYIGGEFLG